MDRGLYIGLDPGKARRCAFSVVDHLGNFLDAGFFDGAIPHSLTRRMTEGIHSGMLVAVGIDGARHLLSQPRQWDWDERETGWKKLPSGTEAGRHAEIVLRAYGFRDCRWTGPATSASDRHLYTLSLYATCQALRGVEVHETCAQASAQAFDSPGDRLGLPENLEANLADATLAAGSAREFRQGRGLQVGGGDGLGAITLPRPLALAIPGVLEWPEAAA